MLLFSGTSNKLLAEKIATHLSLPLSPIELHTFPDGERRIKVPDAVVGEDTVVIQSTNPPVDQNYMEAFFIVDALKRTGARSATVVMPYMGYQRQDHVFRQGEARSLEVVINLLEKSGADQFISFDFHSIKIPELFKIPVAALSALPLFAELIRQKGWVDKNTVLVSPDMGGLNRIKHIAGLLDNMPTASTVKDRDLVTGNIQINTVNGEIKKRALIVDDMISSGGTIAESCELLSKNGAEEIYVFTTHPVFSEKAPQLLQNSKALKIFVTDSIAIPAKKKFEKLEIVSISEMIAKQLQEWGK